MLDTETRHRLRVAVSDRRREQVDTLPPLEHGIVFVRPRGQEPVTVVVDAVVDAVVVDAQRARLLKATCRWSTVNRPAHVERVLRMLSTARNGRDRSDPGPPLHRVATRPGGSLGVARQTKRLLELAAQRSPSGSAIAARARSICCSRPSRRR